MRPVTNKWIYRFFIALPAFLFPFLLSAQCSITAPANACIDEIVSFKANTSTVPFSYLWDFGDGSTSTQTAPGYKYTLQASRTVTLIVTFPGGSKCTTTHNIIIHPKPVSNFSVAGNSSLCFYKNNICVNDKSTPGPTGNPIVKRVFLWDDGAGDNSNNPSAQKTFCHTYMQTGTYTLLMETTDDKGCLAKSTQKITVLPDYDVSFNSQVIVTPTDCKYSVCFRNTSIPQDTSGISSYMWDFGDGKSSSLMKDYDSVCHNYDSSGFFTARLIIKHTSGCADTANAIFNINKPKFNFKLKLPDEICYGPIITVINDTINAGAQYRWFTRDSGAAIQDVLPDQTNPVSFIPKKPGKIYVRLNMLINNCQMSFVDSVIVKCPVASFTALNSRVCKGGDTTYFCNNTCNYRSYNRKWLWDYKVGEACTTDTKNGINTTRNCRYSVDENGKHLYQFDSVKKYECVEPELFVVDTVNGCQSQSSTIIMLGMPPLDDLKIEHIASNYCTDIGAPDTGREVVFKITGLSCNQAWDMFLNYDSAYSSTSFTKVTPNPQPAHRYPFTADPSGDVTIGFVVRNGGYGTYSSCNSAVTPDKTCVDTVWYHKKFNLAAVPNPVINTQPQKACAPYNFTLRPDDTIQYSVKTMRWDWGDGTVDSLNLNPGDSIIPPNYHTYWKNGSYLAQLTMINTRNCAETQYIALGLGYDDNVLYDSVVCAGDSVKMEEIISYYDKADQLWIDSVRLAQGKEGVMWDFDDGNGFITKKPETKAFFAHAGMYHVRMATHDSTMCRDTFEFTIKAVEADAHIKDMKDTFYCNDNIVRFYDSSFGSPQIPGDMVTKWIWNFGDGKNPAFLTDPFHYYSSFGQQRVQLIIKSKAGCTDTAYKDIVIVGPVPRFEFVTDSIGCDPVKVEFKNTSQRVKTWIWNMGDVSKTVINTDKDSNIKFTYTPPGTYFITLYGADSIYNPNTGNTYFCASTYPDTPLVKKVVVIPNYPVGFQIPDTICEGNPAIIRSVSAARYEFFRWWMGNGDSVFTDTTVFKYSYPTAGNYRIDFKPTYFPGVWERLCIADTFKNITVIPIKADFDVAPNSLAPLFYFVNKSTNAVRYEWDFGHPVSGNKNFSNLKDPSHNYKLDLDSFIVCLRAYNKEGCVDTVCKPVFNDYKPRLFIPNVFTPQGKDSLNPRFDIDIYRAEHYHLSIFNRWGEKVFEGTDDGEGINSPQNWDGIHYTTGAKCPPGVYFVVFEYEILGIDERKMYNGTLTLFSEE